MPHRLPSSRRALALVACLGLAVVTTACDSGGSSKSDSGTTTTTKKKRPHRGSTTTTTTVPSTSTTTTGGTPGTTTPTTPPTTAAPGAQSCGAQAGAISSVVFGGDLGPVPVADYTVTDCRLATSQPIWGAVVLTPKPGQTVPRMTVIVERLGSIWTVHSYDTGPTGCDAPAPVPAELGLGC